MAACVTGLCLTIYLFKSLVPVLSQLLKLGMGRATKGRSRHECIGNPGSERKKKKKKREKTFGKAQAVRLHF